MQVHVGLVLTALISVSSYVPCLADADALILMLSAITFWLSECFLSKGRDLMETSLQLVPFLHMVANCEALHLVPLAVGGSISDDDWTYHLCVNIRRISSGNISLIFPPVMFGSTLYLWSIQSLVPGHPGSVGHEFPLMGWASS